MRELKDLLSTPEGRDFLHANAVYTDADAFTAELTPPADGGLLEKCGIENPQALVCTGQQVYLDYRQSVVSKVTALQALDARAGVVTCSLWHDTDRSATDPAMNKFVWHMQGKQYPVKIVPPRTDELEQRFVVLDSDLLEKAIETLRNYLFRSPIQDKTRANERFEALKAIYHSGGGETLSVFNLKVSDLLLEGVIGYRPRAVWLSAALNDPDFIAAINACVNRLGDVIRVFNDSGAELVAQDINPQVKPLAYDYFPLHYSDPVDGRRLRLRHMVEGGDHYAVAQGKENREYRFHLGAEGGALSIDTIVQAGRWSPDVLLPVFLNRLVSGYVMGKSSALYGVMMRRVIQQVLGQMPAPFLVPETPQPNGDTPDSLLYRYLVV